MCYRESWTNTMGLAKRVSLALNGWLPSPPSPSHIYFSDTWMSFFEDYIGGGLHLLRSLSELLSNKILINDFSCLSTPGRKSLHGTAL